MKRKVLTFFVIFFVIIISSCDLCKAVYGEMELGSRFTLVNENKDKVYILFCFSGPCCKSGFPIVPSKVVDAKFDERWIIARSVKSKDDSFWIIDKDFEVDLSNCKSINCRKIIIDHVYGPLSSAEFKTETEKHNISLSF